MAELFGLPFRKKSCIFVPRLILPMSLAPKRSRAVFRKLEQDLIKLSSKPQAGNVHRLRTGTRRLQILLGELSAENDRSQKKLLKLLGRLRKRAGKLRDVDVQLVALRRLKIPQEPRRKTQLIDELIELRGRHEQKLRKSMDKDTVREIRKRLKRAARTFDPRTSLEPLAVARGMLEQIRYEDGPVTESLLHQYRILSKRARYTAEFANPSSDATQFIAGLKRIQDALGDWHDWLTLTQAARKQLGEVRESSLVAELHNVTGAKFRHAVAVLTQMRTKPNAQPKQRSQASARAEEKTSVPAASAA